MKFSTEIQAQVIQWLKGDLQAQGYRLEDMSTEELERGLQQALQGVGRGLMAAALEEEDEVLHQRGHVCAEPGCSPRRMRREGRRFAQVLSIWGPVRYRRGVYVCECGHRHIPLDEKGGLRPGQPTPHMEQVLALSGAALPFEQARQWVGLVLQVAVSGNTIRRSTQDWGGQVAEEEEGWYERSEQGETVAQRRERVGRSKGRVYVSIDGGFVPLREEGEETSRWREAKMVAWYRMQKSGTKEKHRARDVRLHGTLGAKEAFGRLLWASGFAYGADQAEEVVFVCDGAAWIWDLVEKYFPRAVQIVDWAHAVAYVNRVAQAWTEAAPQEAAAWQERQRQALWQGQVEAVIQACEDLAQVSSLPLVQEAARQAAGYYQNHAHRMAYGAFREAGYAIGSGVIESGIKQTVTARMKVAGASWTEAGAESTLKARTALVARLHTTFASLPLAA